ncbi:hypothetical protein [Sedimentitalea todarodis]|uniref:Peptidase metallopeptidase domain-containing protein n=1 Tax=Sedimentitalea todarodis TaxID=1631240 RepID=A0ABU3VFZ7_9RHOB|nr:hypothetical protein [Sedimentitalea todarodis]MDU9005109.1 hypothetical protein [Sedimentitalea todarodis]
MPVVSDYTSILAYLDAEERRWNATEDLGFPVFVSYSFYTAADLPEVGDLAYAATGVQVMSEAQKAAVRSAMTQFEAVAGITFVETTGEAMVNAHTVTGSDWGGWAYYPYVTDLTSLSGDYVIDVTTGDKLSGNGIGTLLHEIGHSVGLSHTHGGDLTLADALDIRSQTVMSYNWAPTPTDTLGPLDVQALQAIYGNVANMNGWTYGFANGVFEVSGSARDDRIMGVEGPNVLKGRKGDDLIVGRDGDDKLYGGNGDDTLLGMDGADELYGGRGNDRLVSRVQDDENYSDPGSHLLAGGAGDDVLLGGDGEDLMLGGGGKDRLKGGYGNDTLVGGRGSDVLFGDSGADVFRFNPATDRQRDKVRDFVYFADTLEFGAAELVRDDFTVQSSGGGAHSVLTINDGAGIDFDILFKNTVTSDLVSYLDLYHDFS